MKNNAMPKKHIAPFAITAVIFFILGTMFTSAVTNFSNGIISTHGAKFTSVKASTQTIVYDNMRICYDSLIEYSDNGSFEALCSARTAACKISAACSANGLYYGYRSVDDTANPIIQEWNINFIISVYDYLDNACNTYDENQPADENVLALVSAFAPNENGDINFMSIFWNVSNSTLTELSNNGPFDIYVIEETGLNGRRPF